LETATQNWEEIMDVRTRMRSAARCNARREAVAAGDRRLTFAEAWERGVRLHVLVRDVGYEDWLARQFAVDPDPAIDPEHYFIIRHTGGTTGKPKGVAYTHRAWLAAGRDWFYLYPPVEPGDSWLHLAPISHGSGYLFTPIWLSGGRNVMAEKFDPAGLPAARTHRLHVHGADDTERH
jgi:acyl-coenzyme A synthetase/AMP-(fatty) acid ligase